MDAKDQRDTKAAARGLASRGLSAIPIHSPAIPGSQIDDDDAGKRPLVAWQRYQSRCAVLTEIDEWWSTWPDANVGIVTGRISGLIVLDVDGDDGRKSLRTLCGDTLPKTWTSNTGNGFHLYFHHPGTEMRNRVALRPGLDLRGDGGYVVAPPSLHVSGHRYDWMVSPDTVELANLPQWLLELIDGGHCGGPRTAVNAAVDTATALQGVPEGQRNQTVFSLARKFERADIPRTVAERVLLETAKACKPPLKEAEAQRAIASAYSYETRKSDVLEPSVVRTSLQSVSAEEVEWLWRPYIPYGKITLLDGDPGVGKSWLSLAIAAAVSNGSPFDIDQDEREPGHVILLSAEDGLADTIRPRLDCLEANCNFITAIEAISEKDGKRSVNLKDDLARLDGQVTELKPDLVIIDPLFAYLGPNTDAHRANETRAILAPLAELAERHGCAILAVRHLNKASGMAAHYRGLGSIDFLAAARSVLLAGRDPNDPTGQQCALVHLKSNLAAFGPTKGYRIQNDRFRWTGDIEGLSAEGLLAVPDEAEASAREDARAYLSESLGNGPRDAAELLQDAKHAGISESTLRRAKSDLGIQTRREGGVAGSGRWVWALPANEESGSEPEAA